MENNRDDNKSGSLNTADPSAFSDDTALSVFDQASIGASLGPNSASDFGLLTSLKAISNDDGYSVDVASDALHLAALQDDGDSLASPEFIVPVSSSAAPENVHTWQKDQLNDLHFDSRTNTVEQTSLFATIVGSESHENSAIVYKPPVDSLIPVSNYSPQGSGGPHPDGAIPISVTPPESSGLPPEVLVNGDGEIVSALSNSTAGGHSGSGGSSGSGNGTTQNGTASSSPFVINVTYDSSANNAPAAFKADVAAAVSFFESQFTDHVTINIDVGYGEVGGYTLGSGALGESLTYLSNYSYSQIKNALSTDATTANDTSAVGSLPATNPVNGNFWTSTAEAKALGLMGASNQIDGFIGFASGNSFDYNNSDGVTAGQYDFYGTVAHEISEVMGRSLFVGETIGTTSNSYDVLDLFHYSANGVHDFSGTTPGYFSVNGGATNLDNFNTNPNGDYGDWASSAGADSFSAFATPGAVDTISQTDLRELDVLGWNLGSSSSTPVPSPLPSPPPAQADLVISKFSFTGSHFSYEVDNIGGVAAGASTVGVFASSSANGPNSLIGTINSPGLAAGGADTESGAVSWGSGTTGTYYISVTADYKNAVTESNENNNQSGKIALVIGDSNNNTLTGTSGNDVIFGMGGKDMLTGGAGADQFVFNAGLNALKNVATITDFSSAQGDKIVLDHTIFTKLTPEAMGATLASNDFYASANGAAHLATDHILYNTTTGAVFYDPDGTAASAAVQFAVVAQHPALTAHDFILV